MAEQQETNLLQIISLTIENCLGCEKEFLKFSQVDNVHLLLYNLYKPNGTVPSSSLMVTPVGLALQLMCGVEYSNGESLRRLPQLEIGKGSVKMSFKLARLGGISVEYDPDPESDLDMEPSTSKQAQERQERRALIKQIMRSRRQMVYEVNVHRRFDDEDGLDYISFQLNMGEWREVSVVEFHSIFFVQPPRLTELMSTIQQEYASNWLRIIQADASTYRNLREDGNPFDTFAKLLDRQNNDHDHVLLKKLATNCLAACEATRQSERRFLLQIFDKVRIIFEYITINQYTVWFFVPRLNRYTALDEVTVDDFDFCNVRSSIKLIRDESDSFWNRTDHNIMDILLVAFQLALAHLAKQSVLFLGQLEKLSEFVCLQYATATFMNGIQSKADGQGNSTKWFCLRYLHRIIELAETLGLVVFIEYPGAMTLLPENRQVIKCVQKRDDKTGAISWQLGEDVTKKAPSGIQVIKEAINLE
ncbi:PREDICTED: protein ORD [Drosophila arizonae]|uniref:Protein ORD n=1 Tax=Drosophila arizonae TaxID=7263 RepID=A0ABM1PCA8_DROAR|nr:PREDICTED: protein ORD [Drosophila arizonae]